MLTQMLGCLRMPEHLQADTEASNQTSGGHLGNCVEEYFFDVAMIRLYLMVYKIHKLQKTNHIL